MDGHATAGLETVVPASAKEALERSEALLAGTGSYQGLTGALEEKARDPIRYERLHTQLRETVITARENAREVTECYAGCMRLSPRFAEEFRAFWGLKPDFVFEEVGR